MVRFSVVATTRHRHRHQPWRPLGGLGSGARGHAGLCKPRRLLLSISFMGDSAKNWVDSWTGWGLLGRVMRTDRFDGRRTGPTITARRPAGPYPPGWSFDRTLRHYLFIEKQDCWLCTAVPANIAHGTNRPIPMPSAIPKGRSCVRCASLERCRRLPNLMYVRRPGAIVHMQMDLKRR